MDGVASFLDALEKHCPTDAKLTLVGDADELFEIDLHRTPKGVVYGYHATHKALFISRLVRQATNTAAVVLRTFLLEERDRETGYPNKEIRGYRLSLDGER